MVLPVWSNWWLLVDGGKVDDFIIGRDDPSADEDASVMVAVALCMRRGDAGEAYQ